jgi:signal transduction histidine kinase
MDRSQSLQINQQIITYRLLRAVGESLQPENVAYTAVEQVIELTGWKTAALWSLTTTNKLVMRAAVGSVLTDVGVNGRAYRTGDTQIINDLIGESDIGPTYQTTYSTLAVPITRGKRKLGVFNVEKEASFSRAEILLAESMAEVIGMALDNAELYAKAQRRLAAQTALQEAASIIASTLELPVVLKRIAEQMGRAISVTSAYICSYDQETQKSTVLAEYYGPHASAAEKQSDLGVTYYLPESFPDNLQSLNSETFAVTYVDSENLHPHERGHMVQYGAKTCLSVPIRLGGVAIAYAELWDSQQKRIFSADEITLCHGIAQQAAIAMENARLFEVIREEHSRFQALIEADNDGIVLVGIGGQLLVVNEPALAYFRLSGMPEAWLNRPMVDLLAVLQEFAPAAAAMVRTEMKRVRMGDEEAGEGELEIPPRMIHWRNLPVLNSDNLPIGRLIVVRDVTKDYVLEKMRDDLTHTLVHDLRGPLTSISISLDLLEMYEVDPLKYASKRKEAITRAYSSTQKLLELVESILELSRLEGGHLQLKVQPMPMGLLVQNVLDLAAPLAKQNQLTLRGMVEPDLPPVLVDQDLMERVLYNLVQNALKFTLAGGAVTVQARPYLAKEHFVYVEVADTGLGIPQEMEGHLFRKFVRGNQRNKGSGLGLYFCKMGVEAHGGRIWLASSNEQGSKFALILPLALSEG